MEALSRLLGAGEVDEMDDDTDDDGWTLDGTDVNESLAFVSYNSRIAVVISKISWRVVGIIPWLKVSHQFRRILRLPSDSTGSRTYLDAR